MELKPVLLNRIIDNTELYRNDIIISNPISFKIYPDNNVYLNNDEITISDYKYSYDYIGIESQIPYYISNEKKLFYGILSSYYYDENSIPIELQNEINISKEKANEGINEAREIRTDSTNAEKFERAINATGILGESLFDAAIALEGLFLNQYPQIVSGSLEDIILTTMKAIQYLTEAERNVASLLEQLNPDLIRETVLKIYNNGTSEIDSAAEYITEASNYVTNYPNVPQEAIDYIDIANTILITVKNSVNTILANLNNQDFKNINDVLFETTLSIGYLVNAINILNAMTPNSEIQKYIYSLNDLLGALIDYQYSARNISIAQESPDPSVQAQILDNLSIYLESTGENIILALDFENVVTRNYLYDNWVSSFLCFCNSSGFENSDLDLVRLLFRETLDNIEIANLSIEISGTIGNKEFKAVSDTKMIMNFSELGLKPINIRTIISALRNKKITLFQSIEPYYCIDSINPIGNYNISTPDRIIAELTGLLSLKIKLSAEDTQKIYEYKLKRIMKIRGVLIDVRKRALSGIRTSLLVREKSYNNIIYK